MMRVIRTEHNWALSVAFLGVPQLPSAFYLLIPWYTSTLILKHNIYQVPHTIPHIIPWYVFCWNLLIHTRMSSSSIHSYIYYLSYRVYIYIYFFQVFIIYYNLVYTRVYMFLMYVLLIYTLVNLQGLSWAVCSGRAGLGRAAAYQAQIGWARPGRVPSIQTVMGRPVSVGL